MALYLWLLLWTRCGAGARLLSASAEFEDIMNRYAVGELLDHQTFLSAWGTCFRNGPPGDPKVTGEQLALMAERTGQYRSLLQELELPVSATNAEKVAKAIDAAKLKPEGNHFVFTGQNRANLEGALSMLANTLGPELSSKLFLVLSPAKAPFFEQPSPLFGDEVMLAFPAATSEDISEAGKMLCSGQVYRLRIPSNAGDGKCCRGNCR